MRLILASSGIVIVATLILATPRSAVVGQERPAPASTTEQKNPFEGKFIVIVKRSQPNRAAELQNVQVKKFEGRTFLVGFGVDSPNNWQKGLQVWIALDDVSEITVFPTLEQFRRGLAPLQ